MESGLNNQLLQRKIDEFNRRQDRVFVDAQTYGAADQLGPKLDAAVAGHKPPDLLWWAPAFFPKYAEAGALRSLDDFLREEPAVRRDVAERLWAMGTYRGRVYTSPFSANNLAVYYNKRYLAKVEPGGGPLPTTWGELTALAHKLTVRSPDRNVVGLQIPVGRSEWTVLVWQCFLWQAGGELLNGNGRAAFASAAGARAIELWRSMLAAGTAVFSESDAGYKTDDFLAGRVAMMINGPWNYPALRDQRAVDVGVFPLPRDQRAATNIGGESLFLFRSTPARERAAWEFMKFTMSADFQVEWAKGTGYLPVSQSAVASADYQRYLAANPFMKVYVDQMAVGRTRPSLPEYPALSATLGKYLEAALYGKYGPAESLTRAAKEVDALMERPR
jgi:multiple sugar transport system substrate-binding protein